MNDNDRLVTACKDFLQVIEETVPNTTIDWAIVQAEDSVATLRRELGRRIVVTNDVKAARG